MADETNADLPWPGFPPYEEPYESVQPCHWIPRHLERIAHRDYSPVNEGFWILKDAASMLRLLLRSESVKSASKSAVTHCPDKAVRDE